MLVNGKATQFATLAKTAWRTFGCGSKGTLLKDRQEKLEKLKIAIIELRDKITKTKIYIQQNWLKSIPWR